MAEDVTTVAIKVAHYLVFLRPKLQEEPVQATAARIRRNLPHDWKHIMDACRQDKVQKAYVTYGVASAAIAAAMYLPPKSQEALANLF